MTHDLEGLPLLPSPPRLMHLVPSANMIVEHTVIVELKAVQELTAIHKAQILSYLELSGCPVGLLINFHALCRLIEENAGGPYYPGTEEAHTNPTRQRGECLRALACASG